MVKYNLLLCTKFCVSVTSFSTKISTASYGSLNEENHGVNEECAVSTSSTSNNISYDTKKLVGHNMSSQYSASSELTTDHIRMPKKGVVKSCSNRHNVSKKNG